MTHSQQLAAEIDSARPVVNALKRFGPILVAVVAIGLATGAAFVAVVWLDSSLRFLTPAVIRLGQANSPAIAPSAGTTTRADDDTNHVNFIRGTPAAAPAPMQ